MKTYALAALTAGMLLAGQSAYANTATQHIQDRLWDQCSAESREIIANGVRQNIENHVARSEASIRAPASTLELSCLGDLMGASVDVFSQGWSGLGGMLGGIEGMIGDIVNGLKAGLDMRTITAGVERAICGYAEEQFNNASRVLKGSMNDIVNRASGAMPSYNDAFGSLNLGIGSGIFTPGNGQTVTYPSNGQAQTGSVTGQNGGGIMGISTQQQNSSAPQSTEEQINSIWNNITGAR